MGGSYSQAVLISVIVFILCVYNLCVFILSVNLSLSLVLCRGMKVTQRHVLRPHAKSRVTWSPFLRPESTARMIEGNFPPLSALKRMTVALPVKNGVLYMETASARSTLAGSAAQARFFEIVCLCVCVCACVCVCVRVCVCVCVCVYICIYIYVYIYIYIHIYNV